MLTHSDDKNFMCAECGYVTKWKHYLNVHMRKHAGDLRYALKRFLTHLCYILILDLLCKLSFLRAQHQNAQLWVFKVGNSGGGRSIVGSRFNTSCFLS